jgi:hypothetical protein
MATVDLLSSSPPRLVGCYGIAMSSSPVFPSPSALVQKRPQLKSDSRAAPVPTFATASFSSTAQLLGRRKVTAGSTANQEPAGTKPVKGKTSRKPKAVENVDEGEESTVKKPRKPRAKKVEIDPDATAAPTEKPPRKPRAKKDVTEAQSKIPKGRVTKASTGSRAEKDTSKKKTPMVSNHFASATTDSVDPFDISKISENDLLLQEAVKRRRGWTPPKTNVDPLDMTMPAEKDRGGGELTTLSGDKQKTIADLFRSFSYNNGADKAAPERIIDLLGTKKRKLIELVTTNNKTMEPPVPKVKGVKKKPRTITELATSAYSTEANEGDLTILPAPLLQYFSSNNSSSDNMPIKTDGFKVPPKPRSKSPVKAISKASKVKRVMAEAPILLLPHTALKRVEKQQFVFGTSSQLAREDSPTLLRDLQQAMRISNEVEDDPFADNVEGLYLSKSASATERGIEAYMAKRNLWAAASRGVEGKLMDIETVDVSESPKDLPLSESSAPEVNNHGIPSDSTSIPVGDEWQDLDTEDFSTEKSSPKNESSPSKVGPGEAAIGSEVLSSSPKDKGTRKPTLPRGTVSCPKPPAKPGVLPKQKPTAQKPDYGSYTTAKLAKEIASYHFKPVKGRDQMIALLEKCWEGKQKVVANSSQKALEAEVSILDNKPLALRQTPKKQKKKVNTIPEEIYDSDSPLTPPRRRRANIHTPPVPLQLSMTEDPDESLVLSPTTQQIRLHKYITRAITTEPPSKDPKNPNWHEKILLYDPIILEDLAVWLNTGALEKVGWDGEVDPKEVKKWCLEKSICCLWRENLRGAARSRY